jgi:hypothetical protein
VVLDTPACVEWKEGIKDPWAVFRSDKYLLAMREDMMRVLETKSFEGYITELSGYIVKIENLNFSLGQHQSAFHLQVGLQTVVGYRARVSEIFTTIIQYNKELEKFKEKAYVWLSSSYPEVREAKNEKAKEVALSRAIPELLELEKIIEKTLEVARYIDGKLDKNDMTIGNMLKSVSTTYFSPSKNFA